MYLWMQKITGNDTVYQPSMCFSDEPNAHNSFKGHTRPAWLQKAANTSFSVVLPWRQGGRERVGAPLCMRVGDHHPGVLCLQEPNSQSPVKAWNILLNSNLWCLVWSLSFSDVSVTVTNDGAVGTVFWRQAVSFKAWCSAVILPSTGCVCTAHRGEQQCLLENKPAPKNSALKATAWSRHELTVKQILPGKSCLQSKWWLTGEGWQPGHLSHIPGHPQESLLSAATKSHTTYSCALSLYPLPLLSRWLLPYQMSFHITKVLKIPQHLFLELLGPHQPASLDPLLHMPQPRQQAGGCGPAQGDLWSWSYPTAKQKATTQPNGRCYLQLPQEALRNQTETPEC